MALLLFRGTLARRGSGLYLRTCWLLLRRVGCCALRIITAEVTRELCSVIRVDQAEAVSTLQQGIPFNPSDAGVYRQLTKIYFTLNEPKKGRGLWPRRTEISARRCDPGSDAQMRDSSGNHSLEFLLWIVLS
jgi:hypothetical protein